MVDWKTLAEILILPGGHALSPLGYFVMIDQLPKRVALAIIVPLYGACFWILRCLLRVVCSLRDLWCWTLMDP